MKYFTPQLLARCRSSVDDLADEAAKKWDKAIADYHLRLRKIRPELPRGVRQLLKHASLHDAQCLTIQTSGDGAAKDLSLTFRLAGSSLKPAGGVELRYRLAGRTSLSFDKTQKSPNGPLAPYLLYDEFDVEWHRGVKVLTHSLLMTGGLEFCIRFTNLRLRWFGQTLLAASMPSDIVKALSA